MARTLPPDSNGCVICTYCASHGYPRLQARRHGGQLLASRVVLEHKLGRPIKPGMNALHTCDVTRCVAEDHLYEGSDADNIRDQFARSRNPSRKGELNGFAKLSDADKQAIGRSTERTGILAAHYNVHRETIRRYR